MTAARWKTDTGDDDAALLGLAWHHEGFRTMMSAGTYPSGAGGVGARALVFSLAWLGGLSRGGAEYTALQEVLCVRNPSSPNSLTHGSHGSLLLICFILEEGRCNTRYLHIFFWRYLCRFRCFWYPLLSTSIARPIRVEY